MNTDVLSLAFDSGRFFSIPEGTTVWDILNSQFLVTMVAAFLGFLLSRRLRQVKESTEVAAELNLLQHEIDQEESEFLRRDLAQEPSTEDVEAGARGEMISEAGGAPSSPEKDFRDEAYELVYKLKVCIEERVKKADGRHQRTYQSVPRYNYRLIVQAMRNRKDLTESEAIAADMAFHIWEPYGRGRGANRVVPKAVIEALNFAIKELKCQDS